jgi:DNA-binding PadR family transcriptional regulator
MNVHFALLALLAGGPRPGSRLHEEVAGGRGGMPPGSAGQVYPALRRLARAGLVDAGPEQEFRLTASGRRELAGWLRRTPDPADGDELVLKITLAGQVPGTDVHEVIQAHRRFLMESLQRRTRAELDGRAGQSLCLALAGAAELSRLDSVIRWLDTADSLVGWVSDADRDLAIARLREHFAAGRLTHAELDERLTAALTVRTAGDLRGLLADLP